MTGGAGTPHMPRLFPRRIRRGALSRRSLLIGAGTGAVIAGAAAGITGFAVGSKSPQPPVVAPVPASGTHQAGVSRPDVPQRNCLVAIGSFASADLRGALSALGSAIAAVTDADNPMLDVTPDGPGDLSVMVGLGAGSLKRTSHPELAELVRMPAYRGDDTLPSERARWRHPRQRQRDRPDGSSNPCCGC